MLRNARSIEQTSALMNAKQMEDVIFCEDVGVAYVSGHLSLTNLYHTKLW
jgi:hypothetical protein